ncbi:MAG: HAMP domain-containing histidine kinase [Acidobacteriota bacterium]|nr:HAMP domain-containing histidine kinase [Acidobacteriota bacterium]
MKLVVRPAGVTLSLVTILAIILAVLVVLQIRWTNRISQAERDRIQTNMQAQTRGFRRDFFLQLVRICWSFQSAEGRNGRKALDFYAARYDDWMSASARPDMVAGLFIWTSPKSQLLRLDPSSGQYIRVAWPPQFQSLKELLDHAEAPTGQQAAFGSIGPGWILDEESHALFHPFPISTRNLPQSGEERTSGGIIIGLNMNFIWRTLTPELASRYFGAAGGFDYRVSVVGSGNPPEVFYQSPRSSPGGSTLTGDLVESLVGASGGNGMSSRRVGEETASKDRNQDDFFPIIKTARGRNVWRLVVRHRSGSVEAAVVSLRRRDLGVSLGVLLLLAVTVGLLVVSAQRAQGLARLQMDFMAGVSHELRTPLAVICSAAENLADGVIHTSGKVEDYGALIRDEGRRLAEMVEQILSFASARGGRQAYQTLPVDVVALAERTLQSFQPALDAGRVVIEKHFAPDVRPVLGDPGALERCVRNLISNAIKYGGPAGWLGLRIEQSKARGSDEVQITVEDHGNGITPEDLRHIFDPFYRGKNASATQIHGNGLGLSIAKDIAEAAGGRLSVRTRLGHGSCFTLHLPMLEISDKPPAEQPGGFARATRP